MIKVVGGAAVLFGCLAWGLRAGQKLRGRVRLLEEMSRALELIRRELSLNQTPLPRLMEVLSRTSGFPLTAQIFSCFQKVLEKGHGIMNAWQQALDQSDIREEEKRVLLALGQILGRYDAEGQEAAVERLCRELEQRIIRLREETGQMSRVYGVLGVTAGCFLVLMLV